MPSQIAGVSIVSPTVWSGTDQGKHRRSASLTFVRGIHRWPVNSPHKGPVTRKMLHGVMRHGVSSHQQLDYYSGYQQRKKPRSSGPCNVFFVCQRWAKLSVHQQVHPKTKCWMNAYMQAHINFYQLFFNVSGPFVSGCLLTYHNSGLKLWKLWQFQMAFFDETKWGCHTT